MVEGGDEGLEVAGQANPCTSMGTEDWGRRFVDRGLSGLQFAIWYAVLCFVAIRCVVGVDSKMLLQVLGMAGVPK